MKQVVKVKFVDNEGEPKGKDYFYFCNVPHIALGDFVNAPVTPRTPEDKPFRKAIISQVNVPEKEIEPFKEYAKTITERIE